MAYTPTHTHVHTQQQKITSNIVYPTHCHRSPAIIPEFDSFMFLSIYFHHRLSFHLCSCLFLHITHRSNCVSIYLSICLYLSISPVMICKVVFYSHQYICLSIYLSVCLSIYLFMYQSIYTLFFICMFFLYLFISYLCFFLFIHYFIFICAIYLLGQLISFPFSF